MYVCPHGVIYLLTLSFLSLQASHLCHQVNYDPATTDLIFISDSFYPGPWRGAVSQFLKPFILSGTLITLGRRGTEFTAIPKTIYIIRVNIYPTALSHNINWCPIYSPSFTALFLVCINAIKNIHIRPLSFCHDIATIQENNYASFKIFHFNKILSYLFLNQSGSLLTLDRYIRVSIVHCTK
jgi:hypothetical protein